jgi:hypothetical protein
VVSFCHIWLLGGSCNTAICKRRFDAHMHITAESTFSCVNQDLRACSPCAYSNSTTISMLLLLYGRSIYQPVFTLRRSFMATFHDDFMVRCVWSCVQPCFIAAAVVCIPVRLVPMSLQFHAMYYDNTWTAWQVMLHVLVVTVPHSRRTAICTKFMMACHWHTWHAFDTCMNVCVGGWKWGVCV